MKCPVCLTELKVTGKARLETTAEHVCDPNGTPSMKDKYECLNKGCMAFGKCCWDEWGGWYVSDFKWSHEFEKACPDRNTGPFGSPERKINKEVHLKPKRDIPFRNRFFYVQYDPHVTANMNGEIIREKWHFNIVIKNTHYISGLHMLMYMLKSFYGAKKRFLETGSTRYLLNDLEEYFVPRFEDRRWWKRLSTWFFNTFHKDLKKEVLNAVSN